MTLTALKRSFTAFFFFFRGWVLYFNYTIALETFGIQIKEIIQETKKEEEKKNMEIKLDLKSICVIKLRGKNKIEK